jgi:hypothetical protein
VDDVTNTSDYVTMTNTAGQEELYGMSDLGSTPYQVFGTRVVALAQKIDAGPASRGVLNTTDDLDVASLFTGRIFVKDPCCFEIHLHHQHALDVDLVGPDLVIHHIELENSLCIHVIEECGFSIEIVENPLSVSLSECCCK